MNDKKDEHRQSRRATNRTANQKWRSGPHPSQRHRRGEHTDKNPPASAKYIYGLHAAMFALRNPARTTLAIWATENAQRKLSDTLSAQSIPVTPSSPRDLDRRVGADAVHQGIVLEVAPLPTIELADAAESAIASGRPLVLLDQVTDPHNVGAVLRSAAVFGAAAIVMTQRHSPMLGATLAKSASGALDLMPVCLVQNLAKTINELKQQSFIVVGLDGDSSYRLLEDGIAARPERPLALALGAEGKGLRELTRQSCDELCRIGGDGPIASLNVSNAAAIALHLAAMQRRSAS